MAPAAPPRHHDQFRAASCAVLWGRRPPVKSATSVFARSGRAIVLIGRGVRRGRRGLGPLVVAGCDHRNGENEERKGEAHRSVSCRGVRRGDDALPGCDRQEKGRIQGGRMRPRRKHASRGRPVCAQPDLASSADQMHRIRERRHSCQEVPPQLTFRKIRDASMRRMTSAVNPIFQPNGRSAALRQQGQRQRLRQRGRIEPLDRLQQRDPRAFDGGHALHVAAHGVADRFE